jgi:carboxyl-terminal processing protease
VEAPNWQGLLARGSRHLETAFEEPGFIAQHLKNMTPEAIAAFRRDLPTLVQAREARTRQDAQQIVADIAYRAAQQLGMSEPAIILEFACGAMGGLDAYSSFLSAAQLDDLFSQIEGNFVGLGIELKTVDNALEIVGVIEGSPADRAGIRMGDRITGVDGQTTRDHSPDTIADLLKGPEGTQAILTVLDKNDAVRRLRVVRERVDVPSVDRVDILDKQRGIGYFRITSFQKTTSRDVDSALWKLHRQGLRYLIIDVRGNPGGLLTGAVEVADKFVQQGTIVSTRGRSPQEDFDYKAHAVGTWRVPLVVLIDGDSASASEIFAGAIHDHRRGTIVGVRSYGKGSVQGIFPLQVSKAGVRLTTAKFYSPSGQAISDVGVSPDVEVRTAAKPIVGEDGTSQDGSPTDPVLAAGLQIAQSQLSQR